MDKNDYAEMQRSYYETWSHLMIGNHREHNGNPDYMGILLAPISGMQGGLAVDFGCGHGRNVQALLASGRFARVDGVDLSPRNLDFAEKNLLRDGHHPSRFVLMANSGLDASCLPAESYSFAMSTITLQHICCHSIRFSILKDLYRSLTPGGVLSFQMGFGRSPKKTADYFDDAFDAKSTNSLHDVRVTDASQISGDLVRIGFQEDRISTIIRPGMNDHHEKWIYVKAVK